MGFWTWFWIWISLIVVSLIVLGFIGMSVLNRLESVAHQSGRLIRKLLELAAKIEDRPKLGPTTNNLLDDPALAVARRRSLQKARIKKHEQRQRRLRANLKHFDPNESRFH